MTGEPRGSNRAFVLGLDGVPWGHLEGWMRDGHLPNFAALADDGVSGPLESTRPPSTPLAWPSIATGVWPDKHGIYAFYRLRSDYRRRMNTSATLAAPAMWDVATPAVVANVPMTYPAPEIDGALVAGMMSPTMDDGFTHPPALREAIREHVPDYVVGLDWSEYGDDRGAFVEDVTAMVEARRHLLRLLLDRRDWRLFFVVFTAPDRFQHGFWDETALLEHYRLIDDVVGEVREHASARDANLYVVSDHGFGPVDRQVSANGLLARSGHLERKGDDGTRGVLDRAGVTKGAIRDTFSRLGVDLNATLRSLPRWLVDSVAERVPGGHGLYDIDYEASAAFVHGPGNVYVNDTDRFDPGVVAPADRPRVTADLRDRFEAVTDPASGDRVFAVHDGDELFPTDDGSPDLVVVPEPGYKVVKSLSGDVFTDLPPESGDHRPEGVVLAAGPDVADVDDFAGASVVDVAPTVLHGLGEAVPASADGTVLDLFDPDAVPGLRPVETRAYEGASAGGGDGPDHDAGDVEDRLRGLGYVE